MFKNILITLLVVILTACGGKSGDDGLSDPLTPKQQIIGLEDSGKIPKLDRGPTLAGTDADNDGIRDDINAYIERNYATATAAQRAAVMQNARAIQNALLVDTTDIIAVTQVDRQIAKAINCIHDKFDGNNHSKSASAVSADFLAIATNTKKRLLAFLAFDKALDGTVGILPKGDSCD